MLALVFILTLLDPSSAVQSPVQSTIKEPLYILSFKDEDFDHPVAADAENRTRDRNRGGIIARAEDRVDAGGSVVWTESPHPSARYYKAVKLAVRNDSRKPVRSVEWEFIYLCKGMNRVIQSYTVKSEKKIKPGDKQTLVKHIKLLSRRESTCWHAANESPSTLINESPSTLAVIRRVEYADGTAWQRDTP